MTLGLVSWASSDRPALVTESGQVVSYGQLRQDVQALARALPARALIFLVGQNDAATITAYLACLEAGAVPLLLSRDLSAAAFSQLFTVYGPACLFLPQAYPAPMEAFELARTEGEYGLYFSKGAAGPQLHPDLTLLLATSGSTGSPKLVRLSRQNLAANAQSIIDYLGIDADERAITSLPFNYSYGLSVINSHLKAGASIVLSQHTFFDAAFWQQVKTQQVSSLAGVPYSYDMLLKLRFERMDLPSLRTLTQAGGRLDSAKAAQVHTICQARDMRFFTMYGQTEATARIAYLPPQDLERKLGSIGRAIPGGRLWLEDETGTVVDEPGQIGELVYSGPNVALGYAEQPEDLMRGDDWRGQLRTGDLARQDEEGYFFLAGRKHRFLKIFGVRVSLDAVEVWCAQRALVGAAHGRDDLLCVSVEGDECCNLQQHAQALAADLRIHPSALKLRVITALPRLSSGKVDYLCLNAMQ